MSNDSTTTLKELKDLFNKFSQERNWLKYNAPKNVVMSLVRESAELMEIFTQVKQMNSSEILKYHRQEIEDEVADVAHCLFLFCHIANIDLTSTVERIVLQKALKNPLQ